MFKKNRAIRIAVLCLVLVHLFTISCFASERTAYEGIQVWTEGSLTPLVREDTGNAMKITSTNAPTDWWKVKLELPRSAQQGKTYEAKFVFTSNTTGTIKYVVDSATYLTSNEYNVVNGENTFIIRFTAGTDTYNCLELGGLGAFVLTFTEISVTEEGAQEQPGEHTGHHYENGKCSCGAENGFAAVSTWTEGSLTPVVREDTEDAMKIISSNAAGDWWKIKVELPRMVEEGKIYEAKFVFTSNVAGTIKYHVGDATFVDSNEFQVQPGENTFTVRFTAGADTYNCLELGGLDQFALTFTEITVEEQTADLPATGDSGNLILWFGMMAVAGVAICVLLGKKKASF